MVLLLGKSNDGNNCSFDGGNANLTGGTIQNSQTISTFNGSFSAITIYNGSNVTLNGTTIKNNTNGIGVFIFNGTLNIKSGNISTNNGSALFIADNSNQTTVISGGTLDSKSGSGTLWIGGSARGTCKMTGGTIKSSGAECAVRKEAGTSLFTWTKTGGTIQGTTIGI